MTVQTAGPDAVTDALTERAGAGRRGQPSKRQAKSAISSVFESDPGKQPVADVDPLEAAAGPTPAGESDDSRAAPHPGLDTETSAKPAAQWDRATDTVRFDWVEIEHTASQDGPNQAMAKLLIAARAEGANSRWPL